MGFKRLTSVVRYLSWSAAPWKWRFSKADCCSCGKSVFLSLAPTPFMTRCVRCGANVTNLSLIPVITKRFGDKGKSCSAYELSTYGATLDYLRTHFGEVAASEYFPGLESGLEYQGILNQDVQGLTFPDASFDLVTSNQVFEHVPDDMLGYQECCRVLKPGGSLVFSVPLHDIPATRQLAVLKNGHIEWLGRPDYHDSRLGGAKSAPTFWYHSIHDIASRVKDAGFSDVVLEKVMITPAQATPSLVVHAVK